MATVEPCVRDEPHDFVWAHDGPIWSSKALYLCKKCGRTVKA